MNNELIGIISNEGELKGVIEDNSFNVMVQIMESGAKGDKGDQGNDGYTPVKGVDYFDGKDGKDGYTPIKGIDYFDGDQGQKGEDGYTPVKNVDYFDGNDGYTPIKGVDYFDGIDGVNGIDGANGYTPMKGIDYFDGTNGVDGYTPIKNVDYFDGVDGINGTNGIDGQDGYTPIKGVDYFDGEKGEKGDTGLPGSDASVTKSNVISALGYTPPEQDTITTINGKTGAIAKSDIVALGIPAQDTTYGVATTSANGLMSSTDKQNLGANTTSRHTHTNKSVIDKFSEVDNKPYYNGAEIGGAVPNLNLNELILGGRYKIFYNNIEDSLDIEVI